MRVLSLLVVLCLAVSGARAGTPGAALSDARSCCCAGKDSGAETQRPDDQDRLQHRCPCFAQQDRPGVPQPPPSLAEAARTAHQQPLALPVAAVAQLSPTGDLLPRASREREHEPPPTPVRLRTRLLC